MKTAKNKALSSILLFIALWITQTASAWYDPSTQRWLTRDPIGESGFQLLQKARTTSFVSGRGVSSSSRWINRDAVHNKQNLYTFVGNNSLTQIDPLGLAIWVCTRPTEDWYIPGNHSYFWNDQNNKACGRQDKSGGGVNSNKYDTGPGTTDQTCTKIDGSEGKEDSVMKCCKDHANSGPWIPFLTDCHNKVADCLAANGLQSPPFYRFSQYADEGLAKMYDW